MIFRSVLRLGNLLLFLSKMFGLDARNLLLLYFTCYLIFYMPCIFCMPEALTSVFIHSPLKSIILELR